MLSDHLRIARWQLVLCAVLAAILALVLLMIGLRQPPQFVAKATLFFKEPDDRSATLQSGLSVLSSLAGLQTDSQVWAEQEIGRITSRKNLQAFVDNHQLRDRLVKVEVLRGRPDQLADPEFVAKSLRDIIEFTPRSKSRWMDMTVSTPDYELSQFMATTLLEDYIRDRRREQLAQIEVNLAYLRGKLKSDDDLSMQAVTARLASEQMARALVYQSDLGAGMQMIDPPFTSTIPKRLSRLLLLSGALMLFALVFFAGVIVFRWLNWFRT